MRDELGDVGAFHLGPRRVVVVSAPEPARLILADHADAFEKGPSVRIFARPILGEGLISAANQPHRRQRRLVQPPFAPRQVAAYVDAMTDDVDKARATWPDGGEIDLVEEMTHLSLRIIGRTLFSVDLVDEAAELREAIEIVQRHVTGLMRTLVPLPLSVPTPRNRRVRRAVDRLNETILRMIAERRSGERTDDLLSKLVFSRDSEDGGGFDDRQIRDEVMTLFVAGHETTAYALAWTWLLLCEHPAVYARLLGEVDRALAGRPPRSQDLDRLPWTQQVLKESLRLYPPVHSLGRVSTRALELGPFHLRRGSIVIVSQFLLHRRADLFPDPDAFDPERFSPAREAKLDRFAYLPFGAGPRVCIGNNFAFTESVLILARLAQTVRFELIPGQSIRPEMLVTLRPHPAVRVRVQARAGGGRS